ncbi:hypothetical protein SAMN05518801_104258 [Novosphingobium sp. CF614]|nr:hypothetical protein SAMN05518801_104258 [Novosphingobium sp. CF614]
MPIRDERAISVEGTQLIAAMLSKDALVLVIYGDSNPSSSAMTAAGESIAAGYPLRGVIYGPTRHDARVVVEFYADSQLTATLLNADAQDKASIRTEIARGYDEVVGPRRRAAQR